MCLFTLPTFGIWRVGSFLPCSLFFPATSVLFYLGYFLKGMYIGDAKSFDVRPRRVKIEIGIVTVSTWLNFNGANTRSVIILLFMVYDIS